MCMQTNMANTILANVTSTVSINSDGKKVTNYAKWIFMFCIKQKCIGALTI